MVSSRKHGAFPLGAGRGWRTALGISLLALGLGTTAISLAQTQASIQQLFQEAQAARARGDLEQAAREYAEVIRLDPGFANAYHNLGIVYLSQRRYQDAVGVLEKAVRLNPRLAGAHMVLGLAHYELDQSEEAVRAFQDAQRLDPNDANALLFLGKAQMQLHHYRDAADTFEKLSRSRPQDLDVLYNLSLAYLKLLVETADRLSAIAPNSFQFSLLEAQDAEAHDNDGAAIQYYQKALGFKPNAVGIHYALGSAYARDGKFDEAVAEFKSELQLNSDDPLALWKLGEIILHRNPGEAVQYLQRAVILNPEFPQGVLAYGRALLRAGETEKAIEQFQRVVKLAPEEDTVHYLLASAYRKLGRQAEADAEIAQFQELARMKSAERAALARELLTSNQQGKAEAPDLEPGFSPSRQPVHP